MTTPTNREADNWEKEFDKKFCFDDLDTPDLKPVKSLRTNKNQTTDIKQFIRQTHLDLLREVEQWMRIENSVSIVHQEEWEAFMKELKGRYE